jgi:hypothetical protein
MTSETEAPRTHELPLGEDIEQLELGLTKMSVTGNELSLYNGEVVIKVRYSKNAEKTASDAKKALIDKGHFNDKLERLDDFEALLMDRLVELKQKLLSEAKRGSEKKSAYEDATMAKISKCKADIEHVKNAAGEISPEVWRDGLVERYNELRRIVDKNIPEI